MLQAWWSSHAALVLAAGAILLSYLFGAIPFGLLVSWSKGVDIRRHGSGNIGATNVGRLLGKRYGFLVFGLDFLKGFGPVLVVRQYASLSSVPLLRYDLPVLCALAAVLGHVFPVWLRFRGGKAGATGLGVGAVLSPASMLAATVVFILAVMLTRYVSIGTMLGAVAYVTAWHLLAWTDAWPWDRQHMAVSIFCVCIAVLVVVRHRDNIRRLLAGQEHRVSLWGRKQ